MFRRAFCLGIFLLGMVGCAAPPTAPSIAQLPWQDRAFDYDPALVAVDRDELFRLDPQLLGILKDPATQRLQTPQRLDRLLALLYGAEHQRFAYAAGHSTVAAQTWQAKRGDCLSLTVLTYAAARVLGLPARVQDVDVPVAYDRRGDFDVLNHHVNVLFPRARRALREDSHESLDVIVDFEPAFGDFRRGRTLSEAGILARFYNNLAVEHLAAGRDSLAYAHFKAAITSDPAFAASYSNLATLYRRSQMPGAAEVLLRQAVLLARPADVALESLHRLLVEQGRAEEALPIASQLASARSRDPYYWIGLGVRSLKEGEFRRAVDALERAEEMTTGFTEVHRYLALAYWHTGKVVRANEELALLESLDEGDPDAMLLRKKFKTLAK